MFCCFLQKTPQSTKEVVEESEVVDHLERLPPSVIVFRYHELKLATRDFHPENKLGEGEFGHVYKGTLANGRDVAVKILSPDSHQGKSEFMNEVRTITSVHHRNLIVLYGCCVNGSKRLLVYEYLPNKSLDTFLFDDSEDGASLMNWNTRLHIIMGIARGLSYLHQDSQVRIIHRDIKASNILLDEDLAPKIADFGLARLFSHDISHVTTRVAGTLGYLSPEYAIHGRLTDKADVFSFGVVALEILSGRRNTDPMQPQEKRRLLDWAWKCYTQREQLQLLDSRLSENDPPFEELFRAIHVALLCVQSSAHDRPSMRKVIHMLAGHSKISETPNIPPYVVAKQVETEATVLSSTHCPSQSSSLGRVI